MLTFAISASSAARLRTRKKLANTMQIIRKSSTISLPEIHLMANTLVLALGLEEQLSPIRGKQELRVQWKVTHP